MERLTGVAASPGIAIGVAHVLGSRVDVHERRVAAEAVEAELARFEHALKTTDDQLARIQQQIAEREGDEHQYRVLEAHRLMLTDVHLVEQTRRHIRDDHAGAEWAVRKALDQIQAVFERIEDPYFRDRRSDFAYVGENLLRNLMGGMPTDPCGHGFIAPSGTCDDDAPHRCNLTVPHVAHVCGCGASDHQHF